MNFAIYILCMAAVLCGCERNEAVQLPEVGMENACILGSQLDERSIFYSDNSEYMWEFFDFRSEGEAGIGLDLAHPSNTSEKFWINPPNTAFSEMYFGIFAGISEEDILTVRTYKHLSDAKVRSISLYSEYLEKPSYTFEELRLTADLNDSSFKSGMYVICAEMRYHGELYSCNLYLAVGCGGEKQSYICSAVCHDIARDGGIAQCSAKLEKMIGEAGVTAENSLDQNVAYPFEAEGKTEFDTQYWINKAAEIAAGYEDTSNAFKALLVHDWMTSNLLFDRYKSNVLESPRYVYSDGGEVSVDTSLYVSKTYVGVCRDFSEIYGIMCRSLGVPCVVCMSQDNSHAWNALYLNGRWRQTDVTHDIRRYSDSKNANDVKNNDPYSLYSYDNFFTYNEVKTPDHLSKYLLRAAANLH